MKSYVICTFLLFTSAFSGASDIVENHKFSSSLENRIKEYIKVIDPHSQVFVSVKFKRKSLEKTLPGTYLETDEVNSFLEKNGVLGKKIQKIKIKIYTKLDNFPSWIKPEIVDLLDAKDSIVDLNINKVSTETLAIIENETRKAKTYPVFEEFAKELEKYKSFYHEKLLLGLYGSGILFFGILLFIFWLHSRNRSLLTNQFKSLTTAIKDTQIGQGGPIIDVEKKIDQKRQNILPASLNSQLDLNFKQVLAMVSDCYWCEEDSYASFLWQHITSDIREKLLMEWSVASEYVKYLSNINPENLNMEKLPCYLKPISLEYLSQRDLANWISDNPEAWSLLSPIRQKSLPIKFEERIRLVATKNDDYPLPPPPNIRSENRLLDNSLDFFELTIEDEQKILDSSDILPVENRGQFPTLIWFSHQSLEKRQMALKQLSAKDIAKVWVGPDKVIKKIEEALPDKKLMLVHEYLKTTTPDRYSQEFLYLFRKGLEDNEAA